jgi:hypothetical protein
VIVLGLEELDEYITLRHGRDLFRLETLRHYDVESDDDDLARYIRGESVPAAVAKGPWLEQLRREAAEGKHSRRVRVLVPPLSNYERYECEWGYTYNGDAGEDIRILELPSETERSEQLSEDFYVVDGSFVLRMHYDDHGRFIGATEAPPEQLQRYLVIRDASWQASEPFSRWWEAHPQYWRRNWAA